MDTIDTRIQRARKLKKWKQIHLQSETGKSIGTIRNWEGDKVKIDDGDIHLLASVLEVSADWLRTGEGEMHADDPDTMIRHGYEALVETIPHAVALLDTELRFLRVNRAYLDAWELGDVDITGQTMYEVLPDVSPEGRDRISRVLAGETIYLGDPEPYSWRRANGRVYWSRLRMFPWHNESGAVAGIVVMCSTSLDVHNVPQLGASSPAETSAPSGEILPRADLDTSEKRGYATGAFPGTREDDMVITHDFIEAMGKTAQFVMDPAAFLLIARLIAKGKSPRVRVIVEEGEQDTPPKNTP